MQVGLAFKLNIHAAIDIEKYAIRHLAIYMKWYRDLYISGKKASKDTEKQPEYKNFIPGGNVRQRFLKIIGSQTLIKTKIQV